MNMLTINGITYRRYKVKSIKTTLCMLTYKYFVRYDAVNKLNFENLKIFSDISSDNIHVRNYVLKLLSV